MRFLLAAAAAVVVVLPTFECAFACLRSARGVCSLRNAGSPSNPPVNASPSGRDESVFPSASLSEAEAEVEAEIETEVEAEVETEAEAESKEDEVGEDAAVEGWGAQEGSSCCCCVFCKSSASKSSGGRDPELIQRDNFLSIDRPNERTTERPTDRPVDRRTGSE